MKIGMSFWGVCAPFDKQPLIDTADGHRYGRPILIKALEARGHEVIALQPTMGESILPYDAGFPAIDLLFVEWRWPIYKEAGVTRQNELLTIYQHRCPVIAFDTDLNITEEDEARWPGMHIASASKYYPRKRDYLPFWSDWKVKMHPSDPLPIYGYIGNNYDRSEAFERYYFSAAKRLRNSGIQTTMIGNWLQKSPERELPEQLITNIDTVAFCPRLDFRASMGILNKFLCTTHVTRKKYIETGFVSPRYIEAAICGCPSLTPIDAPLTLGLDVSDAKSVYEQVNRVKIMSSHERLNLVMNQLDQLRTVPEYDVSYAVNYLESKI